MSAPLKVLLAKIGLDGHDRGVKVIARALVEAGFEVVYTGLHRPAEDVVKAAIEEDVDLIGISLLSGAHMTHVPRVLELLREKNSSDISVVVGGIIPEEDIPKLKALGVKEVFLPGTPLNTIVNWIKANITKKSLTKPF